MIFLSHFKHPVLVMKTMKTDKEGDIKQEPIYITFEDNVYETNDEEIIKFLKSRKNFGAEYWQVDKVPTDKGYQGHANVVTRMDSPAQQLAEKNVEVSKLSAQVEQLTALVQQLINAPVQILEQAEPGEGEDVLDKRTKAYKDSLKA